MTNIINNRITPFILVFFIFMASAVHADTKEESTTSVDNSLPEHSLGIVIFPVSILPLDIALYTEPNANSELSEYSLHIEAQPNPTYTFAMRQWEEENPNAGWFDEKMMVKQEFVPLVEFYNGVNRVGPHFYAKTPEWIKLQYGWMPLSEAFSRDGMIGLWQKIVGQDSEFEEFIIPDNFEHLQETGLGRIKDMRKETVYSAFKPLSVYKDPSDSVKLVEPEDNMRFVIVGRSGNWLNVFLVLNECDAATGKRDYREGTNGWIPLFQPSGEPSLIKRAEKC